MKDNRVAEAAKWFRYLGEKYPDKPILDGVPNSFPRNLTLDQYAVVALCTGKTSRTRRKALPDGGD